MSRMWGKEGVEEEVWELYLGRVGEAGGRRRSEIGRIASRPAGHPGFGPSAIAAAPSSPCRLNLGE